MLRSMETSQKATLHVEVRVKNDSNSIIRTDIVRNEVVSWLVENFAILSLGQEFTSFEDFNGTQGQYLDVIRIIECSGGPMEEETYRLNEVNLDVQAYQLQNELFIPEKNEDDAPQAHIVALPSKVLDGIWESLLFDDPIASNILRALSRMLLFAWKKLDPWMINWNRIILLYGPPGTGKTSLCRALAQKLSIRLGKCFPQGKLVEINANSLGSKYFSESGKLVSKVFESVETLSDEEPDTLLCLFIDEIETLAVKREQTLNGNDPFDAMRATNALLTAFDRLKNHPNVIILCTSNLITALDSAFYDRIDIKQYVPNLSAKSIYEIYRSCLITLHKSGLISGASFDVVQSNAKDADSPLQYISQAASDLAIPNYTGVVLWYHIFPQSIPKRLADIAKASESLSGRTLRRLPALSLVLYTNQDVCTVDQAVDALADGVKEEIRAKHEAIPGIDGA